MTDIMVITESENMECIYGLCSDKGNYRQINQDAATIKYMAVEKHTVVFAAVCDGMGGLTEGEYASTFVINSFNTWFDNNVKERILNNLQEDIIAFLADDIEELIYMQNRNILEYGKRKGIRVGTTLTALLIVDHEYCIAQIGDSRAYLTGRKLVQLTIDQSLVAEEIRKGQLTKEAAKYDKRKNIILQCIGVKEEVKPVFSVGIVEKNTSYFLCSDGFVHKLDEEEMALLMNPNFITSIEMAEEKLKEGIEIVKKRGEKDNITVVLIKIN